VRRLASKLQRVQLFIMQDGNCAICNEPLDHRAEADHIQPFSERGETELWNLQMLCKACHSEKSRESASARRSIP
jgi:5-methylcytosine-specific restriction enzyme A